jgi:hypothetical protein
VSSRSLLIVCNAGVAGFAVAAVAIHFIQPQMNPLHDALSYYMNGRLGWLLGAALTALGAGSLALAGALPPAASRIGRWGLMLWGAGAIIGGIFPPDPMGQWDKPPSISGMVHGGAAMIAFLAFPVAAIALSRPSSRQPLLTATAIACAATLLVFFAALAPVFSDRPPVLLGLVERVLLAFYLIWLAMAAATVRRGVTGKLTSAAAASRSSA